VPYPPAGYAQPFGGPAQTAVLTAPPVVTGPIITSDPRPRQSWMWRTIKWPIRNVLKALYYIGVAFKRHRAVAGVLGVLLLGLLGGAFAVYHFANPGAGGAQQAATSSQTGQTPFTIVEPAQPPLPASVIQWLHGNETFNAQEIWDSYSPEFQQALQQRGITVKSLQDGLNQSQQGGFAFEQFIYAGGYDSPTGFSHYSVEIVLAQGNQRGIQDWYFITDPNGKILVARNLSPQ
jgi:hypothetical protein